MTRADRLKIIGTDQIRRIELRKGDDLMTVSVTEDGRYRADIEGSVSAANHGNADGLLVEIGRFLGGKLTILKNAHGSHHIDHSHVAIIKN